MGGDRGEMSRSPIHGDIISFCTKGADLDVGRLRINLGGKPKLSAKAGAWPVVEQAGGSSPQQPPAPQASKDVVVEMSVPKQEGDGLQGWVVTAGYSLFGMALALCNLLSVPSAGQVCSAVCPLPMCCLMAQGLAVAAFGQRVLGVSLFACAWALPLVCAAWSLLLATPLVLFLAGVQAWVAWHWAGCLCCGGLCASLALAFLGPAYGVEPRWGTTVALFFLVVLCVMASLGRLGVARAAFRVKCLV